MITVQDRFARDFASARDRFLAAASRNGGVVRTIPHPLRGPRGEELATDVVRFGGPTCPQLLVLIAGVHGVEHFVGSAALTNWLEYEGPTRLAPGQAVVLIHGINPWGAAWSRRYTEDNVDLARNFLAAGSPAPENPAYGAIHEELSALEPDGIDAFLEEHFAKLGERDAVEALMSGQYAHPDGFSFGGTHPCWSHRTIEAILGEHAAAADNVCLVEYHSGLGEWGKGMPVCMQNGPELQRVVRIFGDDVVAPRSSGETHSAPGHTTDGYAKFLEGKQVSSIVLEFGTYPPQRSLPVLLADHWLHCHPEAPSDTAERIRSENLEMHCPDDPAWEAQVLARSEAVIGMALRGLAEP